MTSRTSSEMKASEKRSVELKFMSELKSGNLETCRELLNVLEDVNFGNSHYNTKTESFASYEKKINDYCKNDLSLENLQVEVNPINRSGLNTHTENPLITMARNGFLEPVIFLIDECGADIDYVSIENTTAIMYAFQCGHSDIVAELLQRGAAIEVKTLTKTKKMTDFCDLTRNASYMDLINYLINSLRLQNQTEVVQHNEQ